MFAGFYKESADLLMNLNSLLKVMQKLMTGLLVMLRLVVSHSEHNANALNLCIIRHQSFPKSTSKLSEFVQKTTNRFSNLRLSLDTKKVRPASLLGPPPIILCISLSPLFRGQYCLVSYVALTREWAILMQGRAIQAMKFWVQ